MTWIIISTLLYITIVTNNHQSYIYIYIYDDYFILNYNVKNITL